MRGSMACRFPLASTLMLIAASACGTASITAKERRNARIYGRGSFHAGESREVTHRTERARGETGVVNRSNRQPDVPFENRCLQLRALSALPQCSGEDDAIPDWSAVGSFAARNGARDADELGAHLFGRQSDLRITVSSEIEKLEVRSQIGVGQRPCALEVEALCILETRADAVP